MGLQIGKSTGRKQRDSSPFGGGFEQKQASLPLGTAANTATLAHRAQEFPTHLNSSDILYLQRTIGNSAVSNLLARKTRAGEQSDPPIGAQGGAVDGATAQAIQGAKSGGTSLPQQFAADMQSQIGVDVRHARIHTGTRAEILNRKLNAEAFTHGRDIFFSKGAYQPGTATGKKLLAHELTHVAQQTGANTSRIQPKLRVGPANDHLEQEADRVADSVASPHAGGPQKLQATGNALVQRRLKFKAEDLDGEVSKRGKRAGKLGFESTFSKLQRYLNAYWDAGDDMQMQATLLTKMKAMVEKWLNRFERKEHFDANHGLKAMSIMGLKREIDIELPKVKDKIASVDFMTKFGMGSSYSKGYTMNPAHDMLDVGKQMKHMEKHNIPLPNDPSDLRVPDGKGGEKGTFVSQDKWQELGERYKSEKPLGLTPANRAALDLYTTDQFRWMNPAMANSSEWFQGAINKRFNEDDWERTDKNWKKTAMAQNKEMGNMLVASLNKLPNWKQDKTIYRGETIPEKEAQKMKVGTVKKFAFFVSTSQALSTPLSQIGQFLTEERPWGIVYHITSAKSGKDIAPWSNSPGEEEILFAPNTKFQVTRIISRDNTKNMLQVEVKQV